MLEVQGMKPCPEASSMFQKEDVAPHEYLMLSNPQNLENLPESCSYAELISDECPEGPSLARLYLSYSFEMSYAEVLG